jgi:hypothetical protein
MHYVSSVITFSLEQPMLIMEIRVCGSIYLRWMYPVERYWKDIWRTYTIWKHWLLRGTLQKKLFVRIASLLRYELWGRSLRHLYIYWNLNWMTMVKLISIFTWRLFCDMLPTKANLMVCIIISSNAITFTFSDAEK